MIGETTEIVDRVEAFRKTNKNSGLLLSRCFLHYTRF
jgi:hypothetical protein